MESKRSASAPKRGMNRNTHISQLDNIEYPFALNADTESETGEVLNITNEPSNYFGVDFPDNYKVIGYKKNLLEERTYYFLTNPITKKSSIGYVDDTFIEIYNDDTYVDCSDCQENHNQLGISLEDITQTPNKVYVELINDLCLPIGEGLNFDIDLPVKFIEIKNEKLGTLLYWDDYNNPSRWMNASDIQYLFTIDEPCEDPIVTDCLIPEKLLEFPHHSRIVLESEEIQTGGNLKQGTYEFYAAYCDLAGNEMTNYSSPTNPISIFDTQKAVTEQSDLDRFTNSAIRIKVNGLDTRFKYYKVVCIERNPINSIQSAFIEGIHPTSNDVIIYTSSGSASDSLYLNSGNNSILRRIDIQDLYKVRPSYEKARGLVASGNRLFHWGLKVKDELNLQPVVNLFSSLFKWQTSAATEHLYKSPIATSKYKGYSRDEVNAFGIRVFDKDGNYSPVFPLVGRPAESGDLDIIPITDTNRVSVEANTPNCSSNSREEKWQIYNTAYQTDVCDNVANQGKEVTEDLQRSCTIIDVVTIPSDSTTIPYSPTFTDLQTYINNNPDVEIPEITPYLEDSYPDDHCQPNFEGDCDAPAFVSYVNSIGNIIYPSDGGVVYNPKDISEYTRNVPPLPQACTPFRTDIVTGEYQRDTDFENNFMPCNGSERETVYFRDFTANNEDCAYAVNVINNNLPSQPTTSYFHNYYGATLLADLLLTQNSTVSDADFNIKLQKGALWFKVNKNGRDEIVFELIKNSQCQNSDNIPAVNKLRYSVFTSCSATTADISEIVDTTVGELTYLDISTYPDTFYVAVDAPIVSEEVPLTCPLPSTETTKYRTAPPCGCFSLATRSVEYDTITISWESIRIDKQETYQSTCTYFMPIINDCDPIPYAKGKFAYWRSTVSYPDNRQLYDSSNLLISPNDLINLSISDREDFANYFTAGIGNEGNYNLTEDTDLTCKPQRFFKFPDNRVAPFMSENNSPFADAVIYPLGISVDENVIESMLNVAVKNNLITQKQRNDIAGFEILRGDNTVHKSIVANGLGYDMYKYTHKEKDYYYSNYPHNDLGEDMLHIDETTNQIIQHPYLGQHNNLFSFLSPDIFQRKVTSGSEITVSGYQMGGTRGRFVDVEKHPQWTILGQSARNTALALAITEVAFEVAVKIADYTIQGTSSQWFIAIGGTSTGGGASSGVAGTAAATALFIAAQAVGGFVNVGKYRYEWLKTFRDLGVTYNFAAMNVSHGYHNRFLRNTTPTEYLRGLSINEYLEDGRFIYRDTDTTEEVRVNNWLREESALFSTGSYPINYDGTYISYDNNKAAPEVGSRTVLSQNDCEIETEYQRNVGSPYITLKNYVPDQWGSVDSIQWLTTNYIFNLGESTSCLNILGGTVSISRFTWKKKLSIFSKTAMGLADKTAFTYSRGKNIGRPRYYCDYESDSTIDILGVPFPDIDSNYVFDCVNEGFYVKPESKQYLYYYGIADFLVESEINCNYRYGGKALKEQFYPNVGDIINWTQQVNVPITEPNTLYYNNIYSLPVSVTPYSNLDVTYDKEIWQKRNIQDNGVIYSEQDVSENDLTDPWLVYKPLNWTEFFTKYGKLIALKDLESYQLLGRFENQQIIIDTVDTLEQVNKNLGTGGIFARRPLEFKATELGFAGTQHSDIASSPFGHLTVDTKRGKVFLLDQSGKNLQPVSDVTGQNQSGLKNWFREQLPFRILRSFPEIDIDNKFKSIGISLGWDARRDRFFITKKDYVPLSDCIEYSPETGLVLNETECGGAEPVITCREGYVYNSETELCERITTIQKCPEGYTFDEITQSCLKVISTPIDPCPPYFGYFTAGTFTSPSQRLYNSEITVPSINNGGVTHFKRDYLGRIVIIGSFTSVDGDSDNHQIIRLTPTGVLDTTFNTGTGFAGSVQGGTTTIAAVDTYPDGSILVAGSFTSYDGNLCAGLARLFSDGSFDASLNTAVGFASQYPRAVKIVEDNKILVAQLYDGTYKGTPSKGILKLLSNGSIDPTFGGGNRFNSFVFADSNGGVNGVTNSQQRCESIEVDNQGRYLVAGRASEYNGTLSRKLVRLLPNGDLDPSFNVGQGFTDSELITNISSSTALYKVQMQGDEILVSGRFNAYKGTPVQGIARLLPNGDLDPTFNNAKIIAGNPIDNADKIIFDFDTNTDGEILMGGNYDGYDGNGVDYMTLTDPDGFLIPFDDPGYNSLLTSVLNTPKCDICDSPCYITTDGEQTYCNCNEYVDALECGDECTDEITQCVCVDTEEPTLQPVLTPIELTDTDYFKPVHWTVVYKPAEQSWTSYFSFLPDYYVNHNEYFQTGYNDDGTLWSHTLGNQSFQVFRGQLFPFTATAVIKNENVSKILKNISVNSEVRRYQNNWDFAQQNKIGFNKLNISNSTNNTGNLVLVQQQSLSDIRKYPITTGNSQQVLYTGIDGKYHINYFYNRVIKQTNNIPIFTWDMQNVERVVNPLAVSFKGKAILERMRGEDFIITLTNDSESRFQVILKNIINDEAVYDS